MFKTNVGTVDRTVRIGGGVLLLGLMAMGTIGMWGWIGVVPLATGLLGTCPLYTMVGLSTCPLKS